MLQILLTDRNFSLNNFNKRKIKSLVRFFPKKDTEKHANSGNPMRNRTAISREQESYH